MENKSFKESFKDPQMIIAICVVLVSFCALFVSLFQAKVMNEQRDLMLQQAKASVWPRIEFGVGKSQELSGKITAYRLAMSNKGVGPALITGIKITYDSKLMKTWGDIFRELELDDSVNFMSSNSAFNDIVLQTGATTEILDLSNNIPLAQAFYDNASKIKIEILYKSIYEDLWKITVPNLRSNKKNIYEQVTGVTINEKEQFTN